MNPTSTSRCDERPIDSARNGAFRRGGRGWNEVKLWQAKRLRVLRAAVLRVCCLLFVCLVWAGPRLGECPAAEPSVQAPTVEHLSADAAKRVAPAEPTGQSPAAEQPRAETGQPNESAAPVSAAENTPFVPAAQGPINNARQWLRSLWVDDSHFAVVTDGAPVDESEQELLWNLLYWARRLDPVNIDRWVQRRWELAQLSDHTAAQRGQLFELRGRVRRVEALSPPVEAAQRLDLPRYYRCEFVLEPAQTAAVVYTASLPRKWLETTALDERSSAAGLFLKFAATDPRQPRPVFIAPHVAWHSDSLLGRLGMDVGLLDELRPRGPIRPAEREAFYQMLAAAGRSKPGELLRTARRNLEASGRAAYSVVPLFTEPQTQVGRLVSFTGTARQVIRVVVDDADIRARFGIDHYYQLGVVTEESSPHPIYFCVLELPEGMPQGSGSGFGERVRVAGFFFKKWFYRPSGKYSNSPEPDGPDATYQPAPLMLGRDLVWYPQSGPSTNTLAAAIAGGLFVVALAGVWLAIWYYGRVDRRFERTIMARTLAGEGGPQLDRIEVAGPSAQEDGSGSDDSGANRPGAAGPGEPSTPA